MPAIELMGRIPAVAPTVTARMRMAATKRTMAATITRQAYGAGTVADLGSTARARLTYGFTYGRVPMTVTTTTATNARRDLYRLIESVNADHDEVEITSKAGSAVLVSGAEFQSLRETAYLLRSPAN